MRDVLGGLARPRALLFVDRFGDMRPADFDALPDAGPAQLLGLAQ